MTDPRPDADIQRPVRSMATVTAQLLAGGSPFETEVVDINGHPTRVWRHAPPDLRAVLEGSRRHGDTTALVYGEERISHGAYVRRVATLALRLREDYGVATGDRVAIAMRNHPEWVMTFFAVTAIGALAVPLNSWWTGEELRFGLTDSGSAVLVADGERLDALADTLPDLGIAVIAVRTGDAPLPPGVRRWNDVLGEETGADVRLPGDPPGPDTPAGIFYTSGTTGVPKGALCSHRNMISNIVSSQYGRARALMRLGLDLDEYQAFADALPTPVILCPLPLFHATGAQTVMLPTLANGGTLVLMYRWDAEEALRLVERERVTAVTAVPAMISQMLAAPSLPEHDLSSLLNLSSGGAPAAPALISRTHARLRDLLLGQGYGLTECSAVATTTGASDYLLKPDSVGVPVATVDVRVVDADGAELPPGNVGEVLVNGPGVVLGYWGRPEATAETFDGGWLHTGDLGRLDEEGFLYIVDRAKDMIIRGGENVYCAEVEATIHEHPAVGEVAVVGVPHEVYGEEVGAVVRPLPGRRVDAEDLRAHARARLAPFKIPTHVRVIGDELPRNAAGKVLKKQVRREHGWD